MPNERFSKTPQRTTRLTTRLVNPFTPWCFKGAHPQFKDVIWQTQSDQRGQETLQTFQREYLADAVSKNEVQRALDVLDHPLWKQTLGPGQTVAKREVVSALNQSSLGTAWRREASVTSLL